MLNEQQIFSSNIAVLIMNHDPHPCSTVMYDYKIVNQKKNVRFKLLLVQFEAYQLDHAYREGTIAQIYWAREGYSCMIYFVFYLEQ